MEIRKTDRGDAKALMELFDEARGTIAQLGIDQWQKGYPSRDVVDSDIAMGQSYAVMCDGELCGTFALMNDYEPLYDKIHDGEWKTGNENRNYLAIHRVAVSVRMRGKGVSTAIINYAERCARSRGAVSLRIDTHRGNVVMRRMLEKHGFLLCGIIHLENGDPRVAYEKVLKYKNESEKRRREELIHIANHDPLTHLINRRRLWEHLRSCEEQKNQIGTNYVISIFDIDSFKKVNDTYGHDCGDFILVEISKLIKENLPKNVKIGRWGGEEFLLLFRAYSDEKAIEEVEKLRKMIDETIFDFLGTKIHITLTFGVSSSSYCDSAEHIIIDADKQLMKGKIQGKNRVVARSLQKSLSENDTLFDSIIDTNHKE